MDAIVLKKVTSHHIFAKLTINETSCTISFNKPLHNFSVNWPMTGKFL